jgi:hypothetical protein
VQNRMGRVPLEGAKSRPLMIARRTVLPGTFAHVLEFRDRGGRRYLSVPGGILENDSITIGVFEGHSVAIPIGIERGYGFKTGISHRLDGGFPFIPIPEIKDQEIILGGRTSYRMSVRMSELEMIGRTWTA